MYIKASRVLKFINILLLNLIFGSLAALLVFYLKPSFDIKDIVNISLVLILSVTLASVMRSYENVTISENKGIGSASIKFPRNRRKYVSKESVDINRSQQRSWLDKLFGEYKIYDTKGDGFRIYRRYFKKNDFELIQTQLHDVLGVDIV